MVRHGTIQDLEATGAAVSGAAGRTAELLRSGIDPAAPVPGLSWSAGETAAHLVTDLREHTALLTGTQQPPADDGDSGNAAQRGAAANRAQLDAFGERDPAVLAGLVEEAAAAFVAAAEAAPSGEPIVTANRVLMTPATLLAIVLGEQLIHGLDLARSAGRPWPISRDDALRVIPGVIAVAADYLDKRSAGDLSAVYELRFAPGERYQFAVDHGRATAGPADGAAGAADCVITADPVAFLLVGYGRTGQWGQILRGKIRAGGRKPWLAMRFGSLLISP